MATSRVIGLDIGSSCVRAAELEFGRQGRGPNATPTLLRAGQVELPSGAVREAEVVQPDVVASAIRNLWAQARFESKDVIIGVGNQRVVVRELDVPAMPAHQIKAALPFQVGDLLPMAVEEALLDYYPTGSADTPQGPVVQGILVAAQRETVTANVLAVEAAGLRPVLVDLNGFALLRSLARGEAVRGTVALVDIGATVTTVVVSERGVPRLVRCLPLGGQSFTTAVAAAMGVPGAEAERIKRELGVTLAAPPELAAAAEAITGAVRTLAESVRNTLVYYTSNHSGNGIDMLVLSGGGSQLRGLGQYLASASRLAATLGDPLAGLRMGKTAPRDALGGTGHQFAVPIGLAYGVAA